MQVGPGCRAEGAQLHAKRHVTHSLQSAGLHVQVPEVVTKLPRLQVLEVDRQFSGTWHVFSDTSFVSRPTSQPSPRACVPISRAVNIICPKLRLGRALLVCHQLKMAETHMTLLVAPYLLARDEIRALPKRTFARPYGTCITSCRRRFELELASLSTLHGLTQLCHVSLIGEEGSTSPTWRGGQWVHYTPGAASQFGGSAGGQPRLQACHRWILKAPGR